MNPDDPRKRIDRAITTDLEIINKLKNVGFFSEMINTLSIPGIQYLITALTTAAMVAKKDDLGFPGSSTN